MSFSFDAFLESPPYDFWESEVYERIESGAPGPRGAGVEREVTVLHARHGFGVHPSVQEGDFGYDGYIRGTLFINGMEVQKAAEGLALTAICPEFYHAFARRIVINKCEPSFYTNLEPVSASESEEFINPKGGSYERIRYDQIAEPWRGLPTNLDGWTVVSAEATVNHDQVHFRRVYSSGVLFPTVYTYTTETTYTEPCSQAQAYQDFLALVDAAPDVTSLAAGQYVFVYYKPEPGSEIVVEFNTGPSGGHCEFPNPYFEDASDAKKVFTNTGAGYSESSSIFWGAQISGFFRRYLLKSQLWRVTGENFSLYTRFSDSNNSTTGSNQSALPSMDGTYLLTGTPGVFQQQVIANKNQNGWPAVP